MIVSSPLFKPSLDRANNVDQTRLQGETAAVPMSIFAHILKIP